MREWRDKSGSGPGKSSPARFVMRLVPFSAAVGATGRSFAPSLASMARVIQVFRLSRWLRAAIAASRCNSGEMRSTNRPEQGRCGSTPRSLQKSR